MSAPRTWIDRFDTAQCTIREPEDEAWVREEAAFRAGWEASERNVTTRIPNAFGPGHVRVTPFITPGEAWRRYRATCHRDARQHVYATLARHRQAPGSGERP
jgi:hypothetical protein